VIGAAVILMLILIGAWVVRRTIRQFDAEHIRQALWRTDNGTGDALDRYWLRRWLEEREQLRERILLGVATRNDRRRWKEFQSERAQLRYRIETGTATERDQIQWQKMQAERECIRQRIVTATASMADRRLWEIWKKQ